MLKFPRRKVGNICTDFACDNLSIVYKHRIARLAYTSSMIVMMETLNAITKKSVYLTK